MEIAEILSLLEGPARKFPRAAIEAALERRDEITPELLRILEETIAKPEEVPNNSMAHVFAMFLLAQFREVRAYPLFIRIASLPSDTIDSLFAEILADSLHKLLASVCAGEMGDIQSLIENEDADEYVRGAALNGLVTLVAVGQKSREEIVSYFGRLFHGGLAREESQVWNELMMCSAHLSAGELLDDIERAYEEGLADPDYVGLDEIKADIALGKDSVLEGLAKDGNFHLVEDTVREIEWWGCFEQTTPREGSSPAPTIQSVRPTPKVGRNDPCPCRSGKKYKKCCGA